MSGKISADFLNQHWVHSHEEDTAAEMVFRPATFDFPRSRGRKGFELKPDGSLIETGIGPTDRPSRASGTWRVDDDGKIAFYGKSESTPNRVMQIASADKDRLAIKK